MMQSKKLFDQKGFTLLEVLLSVVILATGLTCVIRSLVESSRFALAEKDYLTEVLLLENKAVELIEAGNPSKKNINGSFAEPFEEYGYSITTEGLKVNDREDLHQMELVIGKANDPRNKRKINLETYLFNPFTPGD